VRGLWYFFGIVVAAGIFTGTAGLGIGYAAGIVWEQIHRHRRRGRLKAQTEREQAETVEENRGAARPRLRLIGSDRDNEQQDD
jgi:hypothetical protein